VGLRLKKSLPVEFFWNSKFSMKKKLFLDVKLNSKTHFVRKKLRWSTHMMGENGSRATEGRQLQLLLVIELV